MCVPGRYEPYDPEADELLSRSVITSATGMCASKYATKYIKKK